MSKEITSISTDSETIGRLLLQQKDGQNVDGVHALPSGRFSIIYGNVISLADSQQEAREYYNKLVEEKALE